MQAILPRQQAGPSRPRACGDNARSDRADSLCGPDVVAALFAQGRHRGVQRYLTLRPSPTLLPPSGCGRRGRGINEHLERGDSANVVVGVENDGAGWLSVGAQQAAFPPKLAIRTRTFPLCPQCCTRLHACRFVVPFTLPSFGACRPKGWWSHVGLVLVLGSGSGRWLLAWFACALRGEPRRPITVSRSRCKANGAILCSAPASLTTSHFVARGWFRSLCFHSTKLAAVRLSGVQVFG